MDEGLRETQDLNFSVNLCECVDVYVYRVEIRLVNDVSACKSFKLTLKFFLS